MLGLYLGDGHLVTKARVPVLRISCTASWPGLTAQCETAMLAVAAKSVHRVQQTGCVNVQSYSNHWPCLLPQHGPGRKHERRIYLADWQQPIIDANSDSFLAWTISVRWLPRYQQGTTRGGKLFLSEIHLLERVGDIMRLCKASLDRLAIGWRVCRRTMLSVARMEDVAALDHHVGTKF